MALRSIQYFSDKVSPASFFEPFASIKKDQKKPFYPSYIPLSFKVAEARLLQYMGDIQAPTFLHTEGTRILADMQDIDQFAQQFQQHLQTMPNAKYFTAAFGHSIAYRDPNDGYQKMVNLQLDARRMQVALAQRPKQPTVKQEPQPQPQPRPQPQPQPSTSGAAGDVEMEYVESSSEEDVEEVLGDKRKKYPARKPPPVKQEEGLAGFNQQFP